MARSVLSSLSCRCPLNQHEVHSPSPPCRSLPPSHYHHEEGCLFAPRDVMKQSWLHVCGRKKETKTSDSRHRGSNSKFIFYTFFFACRLSVSDSGSRSDDLGLSVSHDTYRQHIGSPRRSPLSLGPVPAAATSFFFILFLSFFFGFPCESVAWRIKLLLGRTFGSGPRTCDFVVKNGPGHRLNEPGGVGWSRNNYWKRLIIKCF